MGIKKYFTLDDLYSFFLNQNQNIKFSSKDSNAEIVVQVLGSLLFDENKSQYGLAPVHLQSCHTGKNRNGSSISATVMKNAFSTFKNKPILAYIHKIENEEGEQEEVFGWHAFHEDEEGNIIYDEKIVGVIPESASPSLEYDVDKQKYYVNVDGYLYEEYTHAKDILEKTGESPVSIEINVTELSFDVKEKVLNIEDFYLSGITILGKDYEGNDVEAGMEGSNIKLTDFSKENNSMVNMSLDLLGAINKLNKMLATFNIESLEKGGEGQMNKFEELLKKYNKVVEDIDFDYESMSDDELEDKFKELFGEVENNENEIVPPETNSSDNFEEENQDISTDIDENLEKEIAEFEEESQEIVDDKSEEDKNQDNYQEDYSIEFSINNMTFKTSLNDIQYALTTLVNDTYAESDGTYYSCIVYDDYVVMIDYWTGTAYRQSYKVRKGVYSLTGDRVSVRAVYLTADEEAEVDKMKTNYSKYEKELQGYHDAESQIIKQEIICKPEFALLQNKSEDYDNLVNDINDSKLHLNYTEEDVQKKCDEILLSYIKAGNQINFETDNNNVNNNSHNHLFRLPQQKGKAKGRYGNLFKK